jgi:C4-dicarboxylate-specific signal transduction histidine kinase
VRQLDEVYPSLREEVLAPGPTSAIGAPVEHLDLATVIKVSQAVSGEIVLEKLIDTLMRTAIEHAGAERGLLILRRGVEQRIEAEATTRGDTIIVRLGEAPARNASAAADSGGSLADVLLPESIVHYVMRTQESVRLDDASLQDLFSEDRYIRQQHARSIICLPLINQAKLIGVLYLENNLAPRAFTPNRIAVLKLLASQAAISLENAQLYRDLEEREAAFQKAQTQLAHVARVATMGELAASIAHEVNQPLGAVVSGASACLRWLEAESLEEARQCASRVIAEGHRAGEIITRIRALAKKAPPKKESLDINETIREAIAMVRSEAHANGVSLQIHLANDLPLILGDRIQLQQVILNLLINAIEAMAGAAADLRVLRVSSQESSEFSGESEEEALHRPDHSQAGTRANSSLPASDVLVAVRDSGPGLDMKSLDRLFDAFYTTKSQGLGMGLAISRSIVEAHGGRLWAENAPRGAIFQFALPIHHE